MPVVDRTRNPAGHVRVFFARDRRTSLRRDQITVFSDRIARPLRADGTGHGLDILVMAFITASQCRE
jgi:hypothetical protein